MTLIPGPSCFFHQDINLTSSLEFNSESLLLKTAPYHYLKMLPLIGVWKLLYVLNSTSNQTSVTGRITFLSSGYMHVLIRSPSTLPPLSANFDWGNASDAQIGTLTRHVTAYCGTYRVVNESGVLYTHTKLDVSLDPSWEVEQMRKASFEEREGRVRMRLEPVLDVSFRGW